MKTGDLVELAARNIRESVLRNALTTLGVGVGVASLVAMLALGIGLQQLASRRLARSGLFDTIAVTSRRSLRGFDRSPGGEAGPSAESRPLDEPARLKIAHLPDVLEAVPDLRFQAEVRYEGKPHFAVVAGLPPSARDTDAFDNLQGRFFSSPAAAEVILQVQFADELLGVRERPDDSSAKLNAQTATLIGKELTLRYAERVSAEVAAGAAPPASEKRDGGGNPPSAAAPPAPPLSAGAGFSVVPRERALRIAAVTDHDPEGLRGAAGARLFLPLQMAESLHALLPAGLRASEPDFSNSPAYPSLSVRVKSPNRVEAVEEAIRKMGFRTYSILDATRSLRRFFAVLDLFLGIFGSLALAVAALGIVNTLVMAILERRREIGIMKAVGASDGDVKMLFLAEAAVLGLLGGVLGVAMGWVMGRLINAGANLFLRRQNLPAEQLWSVPGWLVGGAILFAVLVSMIAGLYPAARAARLDPVEALRYE